MYITFTHNEKRYAVECETELDASIIHMIAEGVFYKVRVNFSGRVGKNVVKLSQDEFSHMTDEIIYNE